MAGRSVNLNYKDQLLWILLPVKGFGHPEDLKSIMIRNPHINFPDAWLFKKDSLVTSFGMTGIEGLTSKEIAEKLFISELTVQTHRKNIMTKLQVRNVAELLKKV